MSSPEYERPRLDDVTFENLIQRTMEVLNLVDTTVASVGEEAAQRLCAPALTALLESEEPFMPPKDDPHDTEGRPVDDPRPLGTRTILTIRDGATAHGEPWSAVLGFTTTSLVVVRLSASARPGLALHTLPLTRAADGSLMTIPDATPPPFAELSGTNIRGVTSGHYVGAYTNEGEVGLWDVDTRRTHTDRLVVVILTDDGPEAPPRLNEADELCIGLRRDRPYPTALGLVTPSASEYPPMLVLALPDRGLLGLRPHGGLALFSASCTAVDAVATEGPFVAAAFANGQVWLYDVRTWAATTDTPSTCVCSSRSKRRTKGTDVGAGAGMDAVLSPSVVLGTAVMSIWFGCDSDGTVTDAVDIIDSLRLAGKERLVGLTSIATDTARAVRAAAALGTGTDADAGTEHPHRHRPRAGVGAGAGAGAGEESVSDTVRAVVDTLYDVDDLLPTLGVLTLSVRDERALIAVGVENDIMIFDSWVPEERGRLTVDVPVAGLVFSGARLLYMCVTSPNVYAFNCDTGESGVLVHDTLAPRIMPYGAQRLEHACLTVPVAGVDTDEPQSATLSCLVVTLSSNNVKLLALL